MYETEQGGPTTATRRRVLVIEDDVAHARIMRWALEDDDDPLDLSHMSSGEDAIAHLQREADERCDTPAYHLILLDLRLPGVDGVAVLQWIKSDPRLRLVPVVMLSTSDRPADINRCYDRGANAFVTKPTLFDEFTARLSALRAFWLDHVALPVAASRETDLHH